MQVCRYAVVGLLAATASLGAAGCRARTEPTAGPDSGPGTAATSRTSAAGGPFEGVVRIRVPGVTTDDAITFEVKGARSRWDLSPQAGRAAGYRIYDASARRLFTVSPEQATVTVDDVPPRVTAGAPWAVTDLGAGKAAGYPCKRSRLTDGVAAFVTCVAPLPIPLEYAVPALTTSIPFLEDIEAKGDVPLVVALEAPDAGVVRGPRLGSQRLFASEVRATPFEDSRFVVPPEFAVTQGHAAIPRTLAR